MMTTTVKVATATRMTMRMSDFPPVIANAIVATIVKGIENEITVTLVAMTTEIELTIGRIMTMTAVVATDLQTGIVPAILGAEIRDGSSIFLSLFSNSGFCTLVYVVKKIIPGILYVTKSSPLPSQFKNREPIALINCAAAQSTTA